MGLQKFFSLLCICGYAVATCNFGSDVIWINPLNNIDSNINNYITITCKNTSTEDYIYEMFKLNHKENDSFKLVQIDIVNSHFPILKNLINPANVINTYTLLEYWFGLKISFCHVKTIIGNAFGNFQTLSDLDLSFNEIDDLAFVKYLPSSVENLYLRNNRIAYFHCDFFTTALLRLDLSFNRLIEVDFCLTPIQITFDINNNAITTLDMYPPSGDIYSDLAINMANNPLQHIKNCDPQTSSKPSFRLLNLTNSLAYLPVGNITKCELKFRSLILGNNKIILDDNLNFSFERPDYANSSITHIPTSIFKDKSFYSLNLSYNDLESLSDSVFNPSTFLETLDLSYSKIKHVDNVFHGVYARFINLSANNIEELQSNSFSGIGSVYSIDLSLNNIVLNKKGFAHCLDLSELNLANSNISVIEEEAFDGLNYLRILRLENNSLKNLKTKVFKPLTSIETINLENNQLTVLPSKLFDSIPVSSIKLSGNRIELIETRSFYSLDRIDSIAINNNNAALRIDTQAFSHLYALKTVNLSGSGLKAANWDMFFKTPILQILDMTSNNVTSIDFSKGSELEALEQLHLTLIGDLMPKSFVGLQFLTHLMFRESNIGIMHSRAFQGLFSLKSLQIRNSDINTLESGALDGLFRLEQLDLENFFINKESLSGISFEDLYSLQNLNLSHQRIRFIAPNTFNGLENLRNLYLNNNSLSIFENSTFTGLQGLRFLDLSYNSLDILKRYYFKYLGNLTTLDLSNNDLHDIELGAFQHFPILKRLILRKNSFNEIKVGTFSNLYNLETLDLAQNKLSSLLFESFLPLQSLSDLNLEFNNLKTFGEYSLVSNLKSLRRIGIAKNKWQCEYLGKMLVRFRKNEINYAASDLNFYGDNIEGIECIDICKFLLCLKDSHGIN